MPTTSFLEKQVADIEARVTGLREEIGPKMDELDKLEAALSVLKGERKKPGRPRKQP